MDQNSTKERIAQALVSVLCRLDSLNRRVNNEVLSPTFSRLLLADAKELVGETVLLMALLNRPDDEEPHTSYRHFYSHGGSTWAVPDLWKAEGIKPVTMPLEDVVDIEALLDSHIWSCGYMSVRDIVREADRIKNADMSYPIILTPDGAIADGVHRVIRAWRERQSSLLVVKLKAMPQPLGFTLSR